MYNATKYRKRVSNVSSSYEGKDNFFVGKVSDVAGTREYKARFINARINGVPLEAKTLRSRGVSSSKGI